MKKIFPLILILLGLFFLTARYPPIVVLARNSVVRTIHNTLYDLEILECDYMGFRRPTGYNKFDWNKYRRRFGPGVVTAS